MPSLTKMLRDLADAYEKEERLEAEGESTKATEERIAALEARLKDAPKEEREEAVEELDDEEWALIVQHRAGKSTPPPDELDDEEETPARPKMRKGRKRGQLYQDEKGGMGYVWQNEDEADLVPVDEVA